MIFPPLYTAEAFALNLEGTTVKVARFDENLLSYDGELVIHVGPDTVIRQANGSDFIGGAEELHGRALVVLYTITTMSLPPQTTPSQIFVLYERAVHLPAEVMAPTVAVETPAELGVEDISGVPILVNDKAIVAPAPFLEGWMVMVPLRAVAEALDYAVIWDGATQSIMLNNVISLSIGKDYYTYARMAPIELGIAPVMVDGVTYVPLSFFREVVRMNNAIFFEGRIEINDGEPMETVE